MLNNEISLGMAPENKYLLGIKQVVLLLAHSK